MLISAKWFEKSCPKYKWSGFRKKVHFYYAWITNMFIFSIEMKTKIIFSIEMTSKIIFSIENQWMVGGGGGGGEK